MPEALIGVDWGTHSSKWNWVSFAGGSLVRGQFKILRSDVQLDQASSRILLSVEQPPANSIFESGIKGSLIKDPDGPFWTGRRKRIKLTLGELVSFSLWSLLSEAYQNLSEHSSAEPRDIEVRFSLPNWVGIAGAAVARSSYEQAARVACSMFLSDRKGWSQTPFPVREEWQISVKNTLEELNISDDSEIDDTGFQSTIQKKLDVDPTMSFRFVAESSAAGLTGLREIEGDIDGQRYLRKMLVVDVGAGSTDIGYVLRTIPNDGSSEALLQLPPANTCQTAGDALTRTIVEIYRTLDEKIGLDEAERRKIVGDDEDWLSHPSVTEWKRVIGEHVQRYVADIADESWLPYEPGLQVLITGGSGIVSGLEEEVLAATKRGLTLRHVEANVIDATAVMKLDSAGRWANDVNRLAVVLGSASEELPRLNYYESLGPRASAVPVRAARGWT